MLLFKTTFKGPDSFFFFAVYDNFNKQTELDKRNEELKNNIEEVTEWIKIVDAEDLVISYLLI